LTKPSPKTDFNLSAFANDEKIELLREQNKTLEEMGQVIFQEWFGKYGVDDELPEGWRVGKLGEVVDLLNGFAYKSSDFIENGKYRLVTIANVQDGSFLEKTKDGLNQIPQKMPDYCNLKKGDILLSLTGNVGRICHVIGKNYFLNQRVAKLQAKEKQDYGFIYTMFRQNSMIGLLENISAGTAQQNLSPIKTAELEIIIPSRENLDDFANIINPMIEKMLDNKHQIQSLARSRDELLPRLMRGEVRVEF
jgi:type I restriction enzyme S subunit